MWKIFIVILLALICGCTSTTTASPTTTPVKLAVLPVNCKTPGKIVSADLPQPSADSPYSYRVYLPPCYLAGSVSRYPVLYLLPGSQSSPDSWLRAGLAEEMNRVILSGKVPPMIVVTTENTDNDLEGNTIYKELLPFVESRYPIAANRRYRAVAGGSLGGVSAYHLAFRHPDTFSSAGIFGAGAFPWDEANIRAWLAQMNDADRTRVFLNSGEQDSYMLERAREMKSLLDESGVQNELYVDQGGHHYKYWIPNFERYLTWLAREW